MKVFHTSVGGVDFYRLALVGDAVLNLFLVEKFFSMGLDEEDIGVLVSDFKSNKALYLAVCDMGLEDVLVCQESARSPYTYASLLEAIVGMKYLEGGLQEAYEFLEEVWVVLKRRYQDFKNYWEELRKTLKEADVVYSEENGLFEAKIVLPGGKVISRAKAKTKKEAKNEAARIALSNGVLGSGVLSR